MEAVRQPDEDGQHGTISLVVEYWIPLEFVDLVQMGFATANLALAADMTNEFDSIAANFGYRTEAV